METEEEFRFLLENRCDEMQGYYLSKPVPQEAFARMLPTPEAGTSLPQ